MSVKPGIVVELFAGVGGFRIGLEGLEGDTNYRKNWVVELANQWEPGTKTQDAASCYAARFGSGHLVCEDISKYLDWALDGDEKAIADSKKIPFPPNFDLLVGGFPCQDYSVAKSLSASAGLAGKKGVLWWEINRILEGRRPKYVLLENVDRLLNSPASQKGRDFAVMLSCFTRLGYSVQWRIINSADYGFPQRRRRVFILAERLDTADISDEDACRILTESGTLAKAFPVEIIQVETSKQLIDKNPGIVSAEFNRIKSKKVWENSGVMVNGVAYTTSLSPSYAGNRLTLGDILEKGKVGAEFYIEKDKISEWKYLKGAKKEPRVNRTTGYSYFYAEGAMHFPDRQDYPSRTILTGEGGRGASRFKHVIKIGKNYRRLTPIELERLQMFPDNWTERREDQSVIPNTRRAFFMGNALVVGIVSRIGEALSETRVKGLDTLNN